MPLESIGEEETGAAVDRQSTTATIISASEASSRSNVMEEKKLNISPAKTPIRKDTGLDVTSQISMTSDSSTFAQVSDSGKSPSPLLKV